MTKTLKTLASLSLLFVAACSSAHSAASPEVNAAGSCCGDKDGKGGCCQEGAKEGKDCCAPATPMRKTN
jgi:hypothetical protein